MTFYTADPRAYARLLKTWKKTGNIDESLVEQGKSAHLVPKFNWAEFKIGTVDYVLQARPIDDALTEFYIRFSSEEDTSSWPIASSVSVTTSYSCFMYQ